MTETENFSAELALMLRPGMKIILTGVMGSGKTTLVRLILGQLGYHGMFQSPSFTLIQEYPDVGPDKILIRHLDVDRIHTEAELHDLGLSELLSDSSVLLIEWGEKFPSLIERATHWITAVVISSEERLWKIENL